MAAFDQFSLDRRSFVRGAVLGGVAASIGGLAFLEGLPSVSAQEARPDPDIVRFRPEIEPLVRLLEDTPRDRLLEQVAERIRGGTSYQEVLAALQLAGVRNIQPRPVALKFHAVMVVNSAHLASLASPDKDRWLPIFWALDYFKAQQAQDVREGDWTMSAPPTAGMSDPRRARAAFVERMEAWDDAGADRAVVALARTAGATETIEPFWRLGARDFRSIGHKAIFVANSWRTLQTIGWQHAEPILPSLAYALLFTDGSDPMAADSIADRPYRENVERVKRIRGGWQAGRADEGATRDLLGALRTASFSDVSESIVKLLNDGIAPEALWDAVLLDAGELIMRQPAITGIHCVTSANALHYAAQTAADDETRRLLLLQAASFMTMFRDRIGETPDLRVDALEGEMVKPGASATEQLEGIFAAISDDRMTAARRTLAYLQANGSPNDLMQAARELIFLKGRDTHDYKFSAACLEDYYHVSPRWRAQFLATSMFNLRGSGHPDNQLVQRTRAALGQA